MRRRLGLILGIALSLAATWLFVRNLEWSRVWEALRHASLPLLFLSIAIGYFGHMALRARRWGVMLRPVAGDVPFNALFTPIVIGYAVSNLFPGRLGEIVRPVLLARRRNIPAAAIVASVVIERVLDVASIGLLAGAAALTSPLWWDRAGLDLRVNFPLAGEHDLVQALAWLGGACLAGTIVGALILGQLVRPGSRFMTGLARRAEAGGRAARVWILLGHVAEGAAFLRSPLLALQVAAESLVLWTVIALSTWITLLAAGVHIPFPGSFLMVAVSAVGVSVPTPGGMGSVHLAMQLGLVNLFGVEPNLAAAATFLFHPVSGYIPPIVFGLLVAWREGVSPASLRQSETPRGESA